MKRVMYHTTTASNAKSILREGLKPQSRGGYTTAYGDAAMLSYYPRRPAFLGAKPWATSGPSDTVLEVDVTDIPLAADIPTVAEDVGLYYGGLVLREFDGHRETYRTRSKKALQLLEPYASRTVGDAGNYEDQIHMEDLATPGSPVAEAAIELTGTAAVYDPIPPERSKIT